VPLVTPTTTTRSRGPRSRSREGEGYQALTGAVLRVLAPLDGSGCTRGTHAPLAGPAVRRGAPTLRGLVPYRSRPLESPFRAFPSRGAVPALAGLFSLVGSHRLPNGAARPEGFTAPFPDRADLSPQLTRRPTGLKKPGRRFPGVARAPHVSRCRGRLRRLVSDTAGLAGLGSRYAHFGALLTSRVRSRILIAALARVRSTGRCSPGPSSPLEHSPASRGFGVRADQRGRERARASSVLETQPPGHMYSPGIESVRGV
jgi:hypothetical protein